MRRVFKGLLTLALLGSFAVAFANCGTCGTSCNTCNTCTTCCDDCSSCDAVGRCDGYPFLLPRSQSVNAARELVGWQPFINKYDMDSYYEAFSVAVEYTRTFREERLAQFFFGNDLVDCCNTLLIQGSAVENRNSKAWLADYFGLSRDFSSKVTFCPRIQNVMVDLNWYQGLDEWAEGLYFRIHAPITWTKWELRMCECITAEGTMDFPAGYMAPDVVELADLAPNFTTAIAGCHTWGDMQSPLCYGIMSNCKQTKTRLSDIQFVFGWNFVRKEDGHFGLNMRFAAPTGNKPCAKYLFEPIVGNGKHWELGGGLTGSWIFWRSEEEEDRYMGMWMDANITHLFKKCMCRSFDFCCKPNSRYMLLEEMESNAEGDRISDDEDEATYATHRYAGNLIPAINWATFDIDVKIDVQADVALKFAYVRDNWSFDLGYNLWARTGEKFCQDCCDDCCDDCCGCPTTCGLYAIKGDSFIYGYRDDGDADSAKALSATQKDADIHTGKNAPASDTVEEASGNPEIDNREDAEVEADTDLVVFTNPQVRAGTSIQPNLVTRCDLNMGKSPKAITHKIFAHFSYAWKDREDEWVPFLGVGGEVEFGQSTDICDDCCNSCCDPCGPCGTTYNTGCNSCSNSCCNNGCGDNCCSKYAGISQWGVWIKGGVAFD